MDRAPRMLALAALVGAGLLAIGGIAAIAVGEDEPFPEALLSAGLIVTLPGYWALDATHHPRYASFGRISALLAGAGQAVIAVAGLATAAGAGDDTLDTLFFLGFIPLALGILGLAIAMYRAAILPRWAAFLLPLGLVLISAFGDGGGFLFGLAWAALAAVLLGRPRAVDRSD